MDSESRWVKLTGTALYWPTDLLQGPFVLFPTPCLLVYTSSPEDDLFKHVCNFLPGMPFQHIQSLPCQVSPILHFWFISSVVYSWNTLSVMLSYTLIRKSASFILFIYTNSLRSPGFTHLLNPFAITSTSTLKGFLIAFLIHTCTSYD